MAPVPAEELFGKVCTFWLEGEREIVGKLLDVTPYFYAVECTMPSDLEDLNAPWITTQWVVDRSKVHAIGFTP